MLEELIRQKIYSFINQFHNIKETKFDDFSIYKTTFFPIQFRGNVIYGFEWTDYDNVSVLCRYGNIDYIELHQIKNIHLLIHILDVVSKYIEAQNKKGSI